MIDLLLGLASSSGLGAILGIAGNYLTQREKRLANVEANTHEKAMAEIDNKRDQAEHAQALSMADKNNDTARIEGNILADVAAGQAFTAGQVAAGRQNSGIPWVEAVKSLMRPILTSYLLIIVSYLTYALHKLVGGFEVLPTTEIYTLYTHLIHQIIFLTVTAVAWWFSSRGTKSVGR